MLRDGAAALALVLALLAAASPAGAAKLVPDGAVTPVAIEISGALYRYYPLAAGRPITVTMQGPASFEAIARWRFDPRTSGVGADAASAQPSPVDVEVELSLDGRARTRHVFRAAAGTASYPNIPGTRAGRPVRLTLDGGIPQGRHVVSLTLVRPTDGVLDLNLLSAAVSVPGPRTKLGGSFRLGVAYDSNLFRYSDADIDDLLDGERPDRFPIESADDVRFEPGVSVSLVREEPGARSTALTLGADLRLAAVNTEKSFARLSARLVERRHRVAYFSLGYEAIPDYHVRALWDADADGTGGYRACSFAKQGFGVEMGSDRSLPVDVAGHWKYEQYWYDPAFVEYDARVMTVGVRGTVRPRAGLRVDLGYSLRQSAAKGYDEPGETRGMSDDSDTTYDQDQYEVHVRLAAGELWGREAIVRFRGAVARRFYLTEKSRADDPYHAGRDDTYFTLAGGVELRLTERASVELFGERRTREAHSDAVPDIGATKDFEAYRLGVRLSVEGVHFLDWTHN
ncbi:MAG: hypothetical protein FJY74_07130 [Candidatus Eisenbacteria bacterium]|nr:hypothetical protein [Candidatus Eisenbacteria bacterium]